MGWGGGRGRSSNFKQKEKVRSRLSKGKKRPVLTTVVTRLVNTGMKKWNLYQCTIHPDWCTMGAGSTLALNFIV
jgi:hypothetical protein